MDTDTAILKQSALFGALGDTELGRLASLTQRRNFQPGEVLTEAGDNAHRYFILASGTLLLAMDRGRAVVLGRPGDFAGLDLLSDSGTCIGTLTALSRGEVLAMDREAFLELLRDDVSTGGDIMARWNGCLEKQAPFLAARDQPETGCPY
jgi:CRP-like cAMP-binding protein